VASLLRYSSRTFDTLDRWRESKRAQKELARVLTISFIVALAVIEMNRLGWLPEPLASQVATNHFYAFDVAFTIFLAYEILELIFGLATSVADSLGKQFEIFSLILLRQSFKELVYFQEPIQWSLNDDDAVQAVKFIVSDAMGALLVFVIIGVYYKLQQHRPITDTKAEQERFVATKKLLSNGLLLVFLGLGLYTLSERVLTGETISFFNTFYTVLIFSDVLIVLISIRYGATYHVVFRNFGFAAATVMIRLALAGPHYFDAALGIGAALFAVGLTLAYNYVSPDVERTEEIEDEQQVIRETSVATPEAQEGEDPVRA
jgi:hypothetical protein